MSWIDGIRHRLSALVNRRREAREMEEEMRFHLEREAEQLMRRGLSARQAKREAARRFGGRDAVAEAVRDESGVRWVEDAVRDLRYGVRQWIRTPLFACVAVLTLGLGVGATTSVFSLVNGILLRPLPFHEADRLVEIRERGDRITYWPSFPNFADWRSRSTSFESMGSATPAGLRPLQTRGEAMNANVVGVSRELFEVLGIVPAVGRGFTARENEPGGPSAVVVSDRFWRTRLGAAVDLAAIDLRLEGEARRVVGVMPPGFRVFFGSSVWDADVMTPMERTPDEGRGSHGYRVIGRLADGLTIERARAEMGSLMAAMKAEYGPVMSDSVRITSMRDVELGGQRRPLMLLMFSAAAVLLVACANLASTLLARGQGRRREMAVRSSLGAGRGRLMRQLLVEGLLLAVAGACLGALLSVGVVGVVRVSGPAELPRLAQTSVDMVAFVFAVLVAVGSGLLLSLYPALRLSRTRTAAAMRGGDRSATSGTRPWNVLVAGEVATAIVLLAVSLLMVRSLRAIIATDLGFDARGVLAMEVTVPETAFPTDAARMAFWSRLSEDLSALPGVTRVGVTNFDPLDASAWMGGVRRPEDGDQSLLLAGWRTVDDGYFETMRMPMIRGRALTRADAASGSPVVVVNDAVAKRLWPEDDPIGKRIRSSFDPRDEWLEVVGVVSEARPWSWETGTQFEMYVPYATRPEQARARLVYVIRTNGDPALLAEPARARVRSLRDDIPATFATVQSRVAATTADRRLVAAILASFGLVALLLCMVGIYGVVAYNVASRTREIGIRIALGAEPKRVGRHIQAGALVVVGVGCVIGLALAIGVTRLVRSQLYDVTPADPLSFAGAIFLILVAATLAAWLPTRRSTKIDPLKTMRMD